MAPNALPQYFGNLLVQSFPSPATQPHIAEVPQCVQQVAQAIEAAPEAGEETNASTAPPQDTQEAVEANEVPGPQYRQQDVSAEVGPPTEGREQTA